MEKLQAALETARQQRGATADRSDRPRPGADRRANRRDKTRELWTSLTSFDPPEKTLRDHRVVTRQASAAASPFDILRTKILLQMRQNGWKRLAITSPMPQCGKTTTACNLALGLGRQNELHSMLFDFDLRDPAIHRFFDHRPADPINRMLSGETNFADHALRIGDNLAVSMSKTSEVDPTKILLANQTLSVIDDIQAQYEPDIMIFDLPSVLVNDDSRAFLKNVDCALIISRANTTRYNHFDNCEREIAEHTNVLGVVLNACRYSGQSQDYT